MYQVSGPAPVKAKVLAELAALVAAAVCAAVAAAVAAAAVVVVVVAPDPGVGAGTNVIGTTCVSPLAAESPNVSVHVSPAACWAAVGGQG